MRGSKLRNTVSKKAAPALEAVPLPPSESRATRGRSTTAAVARAPKGAGDRLRVGSAAQALTLITEPLTSGDGWRHLWLGDTGTGKTVAMRRLIEMPGQFTLVHDTAKARPEYPKLAYFRNPAELLGSPADRVQALPAVAFRGDPYSAVVCTPEEVAALALLCARRHIPVRAVFDELNKAVSDSGRALESPSLLTCYTEGRAMGLSVAAGTQTPQRVPGAVIDSLSSVAVFRCGPRALNYLADRLMFDDEMLAVVPTLPTFHFVLHRPAQPWDRTIYQSPP